ncbi:uncharacterized protein LOC126654150 [Mercurialis annua]|uniref:uncharacterized protein LOC126654150 n=1 Tax=Mercurialis annua TaxID=3986 RepID=UPI00215F5837|nr:uncharacterized protein LOC126654150 [Mercurialis annua]
MDGAKKGKVSGSDTAALSGNDSIPDGSSTNKHLEESDDDWEALADCAATELISSPELPTVSNLSLEEEATVQVPKRRGRGTFSYKQDKLYSDRQSDVSLSDETEEEEESRTSTQQNPESIYSKYGTRHVLVLADFPPSMRTIDLEKFFQGFTDYGVVIRWVNDTMALAVFGTPSVALEARKGVRFPFTVRILDEDDVVLGLIPVKDLEPPRRRPPTSTRTAQRLIAQGMGLKLASTGFGSSELKTQEEARKNRIATRQKMIEDAWGDDES